MIPLSFTPLGTQSNVPVVPAAGLTAALGRPRALVEECHREDALTRWL